MRRTVRYTGSIFAVITGTFFFLSLARSQDFVPGEVIVKFRDDTPDSILNKITSQNDLSSFISGSYAHSVKKASSIVRQKKTVGSLGKTTASFAVFPTSRVIRIQCTDNVAAGHVLEDLEQNSIVEYAQRNYIYKIDQVPNDSAFASQWNLERIGISRLWRSGFFDQPMPAVPVGVLDTGVDYLHPDLAAKIFVNEGETGTDQFGNDKRVNGIDDDGNGFVDDWHGYDFVDSQIPDLGDWSDRDNDPMDDNGHGTAVAGIIGAQVNNSLGIAGISPAAQIVPLRAFNAAGLGTDADIAAAIVYATDNGTKVINMSFGDVIFSRLLRDVLHYAHEKNVLLVASSGNDGTDSPHYPSDFSDVISVGSVSSANVRSFFSSYSSSLALVAPGEAIPTTKLGGGYEPSFSGTSAAAPHVSAIASLMISLDQAKNGGSTNFIPLANEAVRSNILGACQDLGARGWDNFYGAGLLSAAVLLESSTQDVVEIRSPAVDAQLSAPVVPVIGTATTSRLISVALYYGEGDSPSSWTEIAKYDRQHFINDTLALWNISSLPAGTYVVRLQVINSGAGQVESRARVSISPSSPVVQNFSFQDSVIIQEGYGAMVRLRLDKACSATLFYRKHGGALPFSEMSSLGLQLNHAFILTQKNFSPGAAYDFYLEAVDQLGKAVHFPTVAQQATDAYTFTFTGQNISTTGFDELPMTLPPGFLLNRTVTIAGKPTIVMNEYDAAGSFGKLKAFQYLNGSFSPVDSAERRWVPRDIGDVYGDGRMSTLVQDHGVTELFESDPAGNSFFANTIFIDSADVWGSQLYDFNRDGLLDIVARNSTKYLVYQNLGANNFQLAPPLDNPTQPLSGDAINQFGPPRSLVGDFSGTGNPEIIFADYDGDILLYRQAAPFHFQLAWSLESDLFETSDYLAAGDFDGDGRMDFAFAGHSNLDVNGDREYDPPTWTVRIFSHRPNDSLNVFSKIWEQTFYGVKAGLAYDNGITGGKIFSSASDQLFLNLNPYCYIIDHDSTLNTFVPRWVHPSASNSILVSDLNRNGVPEFGINSNGKIRFFEHAFGSTKPQTPWGITASPLSAHAVMLQWSSSAPSATHRIYRDTIPLPSTFLATVVGTSFVDTAVAINKRYWYAVSLANPAESDRSASVSTIAHNPSHIDAVAQTSLNQISLSFSFAIDQSRSSDAVIVVDDSLTPGSISFHSPTKMLLTFGSPFARDSHYVRTRQLFDIYGMRADTTQRIRFFTPIEQMSTFYLKQALFVSQSMITIEYTDTLSPSAVALSNYRLSNAIREFSLKGARFDSLSQRKVFLSIVDNQQFTPFGFRVELTANEKIQNIRGQALNNGRGQTISLVNEIKNLDNILVFPNPLRYSLADANRDHVTFANMPEHCRIDIFYPDGRKVSTLEGSALVDGVRWNLNDEHGHLIGSGIYIFFATQLDENNSEVQTKTGKFAIIR